MRQPLSLIVLLFLGLTVGVFADCGFPVDNHPLKQVRVVDTWKARHVAGGFLSGCLAKFKMRDGDTTFIAYTAYDFICHLDREETLDIYIVYACCDAGEQGDFVCGVKPVNPLASVSQTSEMVVPAHPDRRAIPDLMNQLEKASWGVSQITERLLEYSKVPELAPEITKLIPRLNEILAKTDSTEKRAVIAQLLLNLGGAVSPDQTYEMSLDVLKAARFRLERKDLDALGVVTRHPEKGDMTVPVLVDLLRRIGTEKTDEETVLKAFPVFGKALQPHLDAIHYVIREDAETSKSINPLWRQIACAAFPMPPKLEAQRILWEGGWQGARFQTVDCPLKIGSK